MLVDTTLVTVFDTVRVFLFDTTQVAVVDTVMVSGSLEKDLGDWLIPLVIASITVLGSMWVGSRIAKKTAKQTVKEERNEAKRRMEELTESIKATIGAHSNQLLFTNTGGETIRNAIGYIEIELDSADRVVLKEELDPDKFQLAYFDEINALGESDPETKKYRITMPLCWSMGEYVGGEVGIKNPGVTNIRPQESRGLSVFDIEEITAKGEISKRSFRAIQIPSEFGYSTILRNPRLRSGIFLKFPEEGQIYKVTISLFSDNTNSRKWKVELKRGKDSQLTLVIP